MHFLQSPAWEAFQQSLGKTTFRRSGEGWEYLAILENGGGLKRLYCPYGPTVTSERSLRSALESLKALAQSQKCAYVRVEPLGTEVEKLARKFNLFKIPYSQPTHTWCIDLTQTRDEIIAQMKQNNRNIYRNYQNKGLSYRQSTNPKDIEYLITLLKGVASHNQITVHSDEYFRQQAQQFLPSGDGLLHLIEHKKKVIAAALTYQDNTTVYYAHAAADHEHRKLNASTALLAEIIMQAKDSSREVCDLFGITTSEDSTHRWAGFTKFKKSFGGYEKVLSETYDLPVKKMAYQVYRSARFIARYL